MLHKAERLNTLHPRLADVVRLAAADPALGFDLFVVETARTLERQKMLKAKGASKTLNSKHIPGPDGYARAVDLAPMVEGDLRWDWPLFPVINGAMQRASDQLGVVLTWGGDWKKFRDGPHWELTK